MSSYNSKIKQEYVYVKNAEMGEDVVGWQDDFFNFAKNDSNELKELICIFKDEEDFFYKIELANILLKLGYKNIVKDLKKGLEDLDIRNQYNTAVTLLKCEDISGIEIIEKCVLFPNEILSSSILIDLQQIDNEYGRNLYKKLYFKCIENIQTLEGFSGEKFRKP